MNLLERVYKNINENNLIEANDKVILAISGGPDSVFLAYALGVLKSIIGFEICFAHVNYHLRGDESNLDEELVKQMARQLNVQLHVLKWKKDLRGENLEAGLREVRYDFFRSLCKKTGMSKIALAHNMNDKVETSLMFLIRGSGVRGFTNMRYSEKDLIRPLLNITKDDIVSFLNLEHIPFRVDQTNLESNRTRVKIRNELIPDLERKYNRKVLENVFRASELMLEQESTTDYLIKKELLQIKEENETSDVIKIKVFKSYPNEMQKALIKEIVKHRSREISHGMILEVIRFINTAKTGSIKDFGSLKFLKKSDIILVVNNQ